MPLPFKNKETKTARKERRWGRLEWQKWRANWQSWKKEAARKDHSSRIKARVFPFRLSMQLINSECVFSQAHSVALIKSKETSSFFFREYAQFVSRRLFSRHGPEIFSRKWTWRGAKQHSCVKKKEEISCVFIWVDTSLQCSCDSPILFNLLNRYNEAKKIDIKEKKLLQVLWLRDALFSARDY